MTRSAARCILACVWVGACAAALLAASANADAQSASAHAQSAPTARQLVIVDTDIGDDIDDAFALALVLSSPEFEVLGISTAWGDTALRVRLVQRLLAELGRGDIPVAQGIATESRTPFTQARWAQRGSASLAAAPRAVPPSVDFLLDAIRRHPGEITLLALGPLTNLGAAIQRDPATFRQLKRVVLMGGSVRRGYSKSAFHAQRPPDKEYNIVADAAAAQALFGSGVSIVMLPLDSTQIRFEEAARNAVFAQGTPLTDALALLYHQWLDAYQPWSSTTPTLFDVVPVAYAIDASLCPTSALHIDVDADGATRETGAAPNAQVCLAADEPRLLRLFMQRLTSSVPAPPARSAR
jgi:inosine-uridine nucleoside N-ribohydrolase